MNTTTPSPMGFPCPPISSLQTLVDDTDPRIVYSDGWSTAGSAGLECNGTTHASFHVAGTSTTATFTFEGVGVQVYGTIATTGSPTTTFQVDDLPLYTFTFNTNTGGQTSYRVELYTSPFLEPANHTLIISSIGDTSPEIFLDYITYNPIPSLDLSISSGTTASVPSLAAQSTNDAASTGNSTLLNAGALAGGVIGGLALGFILGIISSFILFQRYKKRKVAQENVQGI
ncbi:hypothetical protein BDP27DRAFT_1356482 [Rhodocollybia butyracea]|uniref:Uncharacterized protein n=1 Tax=Rhodocollybia butyracea TaxID=206335 RepID=A0A9P5QBW6_9AGAR|nr:hypothetical protein BDP27DRAFT_1356482 [Rhodocollybia butyracea]